MKKTKALTCLLTAALIVASLAGCGDTEAAATEEVSLQQEQTQPQDQNQRGNMAKVVSMEGDTITVLLADMSDDSGRGGGTPPGDGAAPGETTGAAVGTDGTTPPDGGGQPGQGGPGGGGREIEFSTEETTYTLSDDVTVIKGMGDSSSEIDLSELAADTVINFTTETGDDGNEVITSIVVME